MIAEGWLIVHIDNLLISSPDKNINIKCTKRVLQRMKELDLHVKIKKCGMILQSGEIAMDPTKLENGSSLPK